MQYLSPRRIAGRHAPRAAVLPLCAATLAAAVAIDPEIPVRWQPVTLTFDGPESSEDATPNPFLDYRLSVSFSHQASGESRVVPGFFAADGDAAESSAAAGSKWRVRFTPPLAGEWAWSAEFRSGPGVAISDAAGDSAAFDGESGSIAVGAAARGAAGFAAKGFLTPSDGHYLRFGNGDRFLKGGADSPENFLGYYEFDGTVDTAAHRGVSSDRGSFLHRYEAHARDWQPGDPTWQGGKGRNIIGALNYLASKGMNSVYFMTYNIDGGDGKDTWVWTDPQVRDRIDVSKLAQWDIVFSHMERLGIAMHLVIQETENDEKLGGSPALNDIRRLYLRELAARFGYHLAIVWNLGEENDTPHADRVAIAGYIRSLDPNNHAITVHTHNTRSLRSYTSLIGSSLFSATSIQGRMQDSNHETVMLRLRSAASGAPWAIFHDEQMPASVGVVPDADDPQHDKPRKHALWGNLMGGGSGVEWYFGYQYPHTDLNCEDWRSRDAMWDQTRHALEFFQRHLPFWEMLPANDLVVGEKAFVFAKEGEIYAVYLPEASGRTQINVAPGRYSLRWYDPRNGGGLQAGKDAIVEAGEMLMRDDGRVQLQPPSHPGQDWVALLEKVSDG
ncbi:MAG: DUF5060 domain-containing protein [Bryobacterales bacterium]|nr:DUF5060 domain-containing protein [Bryobacterales bacterium]